VAVGNVDQQSLLACIQETTNRKWRKPLPNALTRFTENKGVAARCPGWTILMFSVGAEKAQHDDVAQRRTSNVALQTNGIR
jgi:hypothetical protein